MSAETMTTTTKRLVAVGHTSPPVLRRFVVGKLTASGWQYKQADGRVVVVPVKRKKRTTFDGAKAN